MNMKKRSILCMLSGLCLELAGCEVRREGAQLTFVNGTHYTHISIGGLLFGMLLAAFILWWVLAVIRRFMIRTDINFWGCTVANIIDEKTRAENDSADKKIEEIVSKHSKKMTELKTYFEENTKIWEEEIYKKIIE